MATVSRGQTLGATEQVTNVKLHTLVDSASVTDIRNADIASGAGINETKISFDGSTVVTKADAQTVAGDKTFTGTLDFTGSALTSLLEHIYPIGYIITLGVSTNPATLLGIGTWTAIETKFIVGYKSGDSDFGTLDATGGAKTSTSLIAHTHNMQFGNNSAGGGRQIPTSNGNNTYAYDQLTDSTGSGSSFSLLNPFIVKYIWQRTA